MIIFRQLNKVILTGYLLTLSCMCVGQEYPFISNKKSYYSPYIPLMDTTEITNLLHRGNNLMITYPDSAMQYFKAGFELSKSKGFTNGMAEALFNLGGINIRKSQIDLAITLYDQALSYCNLSKSGQFLMPKIYGSLAVAYSFKGEYLKAASYYDSALNKVVILKLPSDNRDNAILYLNYSTVYDRLNQPKQGLYYSTKAMNICRKKGYYDFLTTALNNKGHFHLILNQVDSARIMFKEALQVSLAINDKEGLLLSYMNHGYFYLEENNPNEAIMWFKKAESLIDIHDPYNYPFALYYNLGKAYFKLANYVLAEKKLSYILNHADKIGHKDEIIDMHYMLSEIYAATGNHKKAWIQLKSYQKLKDTLLNNKNTIDINDLEIKYRTAEKDRELAVRDRELAVQNLNIVKAEALKRKQTTWIWVTSLGILLLGLSIVLLRYRQINREKHQRQHKELELLKATMEGEETERIRVGRELHDGVSGFLSAIKMNLITLRMQNEEVEKEPSFQNSLSLADEAADELRKTAHNLVPSNLVKNGLSEAVRFFCERMSNPQTNTLDTQIHGNPIRLDPGKELAIYRIIQELIHNILKHSQATQAIVTINWLTQVLIITLEDNGIGNISKEEDYDGIGMENIRKRLQSVNGSVEVETGNEGGTSMYLYFPL